MRAVPVAVSLGLGLLAIAAVAQLPDPRGWTSATPARGAAHWMGADDAQAPKIKLPPAWAKRLQRKTVVVYLSPTCPHCQNAAPEFAKLGEAVGDLADVWIVASGRSDPAAVEAFRVAYAFPNPILLDTDGGLGDALQITGTPSAALLVPEGGKARLIEGWYPWTPGATVGVRERVAERPFAIFQPGVYLGNAACAPCHIEEQRSWLLTHHAVAYPRLGPDPVQRDPSCLPCHVTGAGAPTGWAPDARPDLRNVGCEACHGPGGPHAGTCTDAASTCKNCHDPDHAAGFAYERALPAIDHYQSTAMTDGAWRDARIAILEGEVGQPLLAFTGPNVPSQTCAGCHAEAAGNGHADVHAGAMASLAAKNKDADPACVRCHATPAVAGPGERALTDYRLEEGVGCTACHGPGTEHVAEPRKDNIVGLGDTCPVCVVDALCTSCHTPAWDPMWSLDERLQSLQAAPDKAQSAP